MRPVLLSTSLAIAAAFAALGPVPAAERIDHASGALGPRLQLAGPGAGGGYEQRSSRPRKKRGKTTALPVPAATA